jgi:serine/threonine protein kinase
MFSKVGLATTSSLNKSKTPFGSQSKSPKQIITLQLTITRKQLTSGTVVIKSVEGHLRVENERDVLKRLQHRTPLLRPLIDEIHEPSTPTTIILKYLESDVLVETVKRTLNRKEIKHVCRNVLDALRVLHEENLVHTSMSLLQPLGLVNGAEDIKLDNVFVDVQESDDDRFTNIELGDLGGCVSVDSEWATSGTQVGTPMWSAPELLMEIPWNTAADIWSFGNLVCFPHSRQMFASA